MTYHSLEEAIENGSQFYYDENHISMGRSGGAVCTKCKTWWKSPRKYKTNHPAYICDCEKCEIKDTFQRLWHNFNRNCNDEEREIHNEWLREVRRNLGNLEYSPHAKTLLRELLYKIPFFEGN